MTEQMQVGQLTVTFDDTVLRPRPWTVEQAQWAAELLSPRTGPAHLLELCAGVGHIGLALAILVPGTLTMVDANQTACRYARENAAAAGLDDRVDVRCGPMESVLAAEERFDCILADPPWVSSRQVGRYPEDPLFAIDGGRDGLDLARVCVDLIGRHLAADGVAVMQLGDAGQAATLRSYVEARPGLQLAVRGVRHPDGNGILVHVGRQG